MALLCMLASIGLVFNALRDGGSGPPVQAALDTEVAQAEKVEVVYMDAPAEAPVAPVQAAPEASAWTTAGPFSNLLAASRIVDSRTEADRRVDLLDAPFKYGWVRLERSLRADGEVRTRAMVGSHVLVQARSRLEAERLHEFTNRKNLTLVPQPAGNLYLVVDTAPDIDTVPDLLRQLFASGFVPEADYLVYTCDTQPADPLVLASNGGATSSTLYGVSIGLVDSGLDADHPALSGYVFLNGSEVEGQAGVDDDANGYNDDLAGWDFVDNDAEPDDLNGHGTHVAGILCGVAEGGEGASGLDIVPARILDASGLGTVSDAVAAIRYLDLLGVRVVNLSWAASASSPALKQAMQDSPALFVAAAGNSGASLTEYPVYPAAYDLDNLIVVGATDGSGALAAFSNYDAYAVDLLAPGADIQSTEPGGFYGTRSGTSMAAPKVAAAAARVFAKDLRLTAVEAAEFVRQAARGEPLLAAYVAQGSVYDADTFQDALYAMPVSAVDAVQTVVYDATFSIPPHADGGAPISGEPDGIGAVNFGSPKIITSIGGYADSCLEFEGGTSACCGYYEQIQFNGNRGADEYRIEFDMYVDKLTDGELVVHLDTPSTHRIDFQPDGTIDVAFAGPNMGTFPFDELFTIRIDISLASNTMTVALNGEVFSTGAFSTSASDISSVRVHLTSDVSGSNRVALDNFRWIANPDSAPTGPPNLKLSASALNFGDVRIDRTKTLSLTAENLGGEELTLSGIATGAPFSMTPDSLTLQPLESAPIEVTFSPESVGAVSGALTFTTNEETGNSYSIPLSALGEDFPDAAMDVTPVALTVNQGLTASETLWLENNGDGTLWWSVIFRESGTDNEITPSWISMPRTSGGTSGNWMSDIDLNISSSTLAAGDHHVDVVVQTDDPDHPEFVVPLTVTVVVDPELSVSTSPIDFGLVDLGTEKTLTLTMANTGTSVLVINSMTTDSALFAVEWTGSLVMAPGGSFDMPLHYTPDGPGLDEAVLQINSNDPDNPTVAITLSGSGKPAPTASVTPSSLFFHLLSGDTATKSIKIGNTAIGTSPLEVSLSVRNVPGDDALEVAGVMIADDPYLRPSPEPAPLLVLSNTTEGIAEATIFIVGAGSAILQIDPVTGETIRTIDLPERASGGPDGLAYDGEFLYFYNYFGRRTLYQFDVTSGQVSASKTIINPIDGLAHDGEFLYVQEYGFRRIAVYDSELELVRYLNPQVSIGGGITAGGSRGTLFVANFGGAISEIDVETGAVINQLSNTRTIYGLGYSEAASALIVGDAGSTVLRYLDPDTGNLIGSASVSMPPSAVAADEAAGGGLQWLSLDTAAGQIAGGSSQKFYVTVDTSRLNAGIYEKEIVVTTNDPLSPEFMVPVTLEVEGAPGIQVTPGLLDFGTLFVGNMETRELEIVNSGTDVLIVDDIFADSSDIDVIGTDFPLAIAPGQRTAVTIRFQPSGPGSLDAMLDIFSNDESDPVYAVPLTAEALEPPIVQVSDSRLEFELMPGQSGSRSFTLFNVGSSPLEWSIHYTQPPKLQAAAALAQASAPTPDLSAAAAPGSLIVRLEPGVDAAEEDALIYLLGANVAYRSKLVDGLVVLELPEATSTAAAVTTLSTDPRVRYAEPDYIVSLDQPVTMNDPRFDELWGLRNTGQTGGTPDADIDADEAWAFSTGSRSVLVGVIDTGVDYNHPDLAANIWTNPGEIPDNGIDDDDNGFVDDVHGWDFANNDNDPMDGHSHGTHCAGTIAGLGNNGTGVVGVSPFCTIVPIKFLADSGSGSTTNAIKCVEYAVTVGVDLTSNSWGGGSFSSALHDVIAAAGEAGQLFIAAAGNTSSNNDSSPHYPSSYDADNIIAVASTDHNDALSSFSCYGATSVDLAAPGSSILSTLPNNGYGSKSGTSMATPHVSGAAALLKAYAPAATAAEIKQALLDSVDPLPALSGKMLSGGRLNVRTALDHVTPPWLSLTPTTGVLAAGGSEAIDVSIDTSTLDAGRHAMNLVITSNDPLTPELTLPVVLFLSEPGSFGIRYMAWANLYFGNVALEGLLSPWHPDADPDGDGRANLLEFFQGTSPGHASRPAERVEADGDRFVWRSVLNEDAETTYYHFEISSGLEGEPWTGGAVQKRIYTEDGVHYLEYSVPMEDQTHAFGKLVIETPGG